MKIKISPLTTIERIADFLMVPLMYILSGTLREKPQETHFWNNTKLSKEDVSHLDPNKLVPSSGSATAKKRWFWKIPIFHIPILGGWKEYVVLQPTDNQPNKEWYIGWICEDVIGVSRIPLKSPVRLLIGPDKAQWFAINSKGDQLNIRMIGSGTIGRGDEYCECPLR